MGRAPRRVARVASATMPAAWLLSLVTLACAATGGTRADVAVVRAQLAAARSRGADRCAAGPWALGEADAAFADRAFALGQAMRARKHLDLAAAEAGLALQLASAPGCAPVPSVRESRIPGSQPTARSVKASGGGGGLASPVGPRPSALVRPVAVTVFVSTPAPRWKVDRWSELSYLE